MQQPSNATTCSANNVRLYLAAPAFHTGFGAALGDRWPGTTSQLSDGEVTVIVLLTAPRERRANVVRDNNAVTRNYKWEPSPLLRPRRGTLRRARRRTTPRHRQTRSPKTGMGSDGARTQRPRYDIATERARRREDLRAATHERVSDLVRAGQRPACADCSVAPSSTRPCPPGPPRLLKNEQVKEPSTSASGMP